MTTSAKLKGERQPGSARKAWDPSFRWPWQPLGTNIAHRWLDSRAIDSANPRLLVTVNTRVFEGLDDLGMPPEEERLQYLLIGTRQSKDPKITYFDVTNMVNSYDQDGTIGHVILVLPNEDPGDLENLKQEKFFGRTGVYLLVNLAQGDAALWVVTPGKPPRWVHFVETGVSEAGSQVPFYNVSSRRVYSRLARLGQRIRNLGRKSDGESEDSVGRAMEHSITVARLKRRLRWMNLLFFFFFFTSVMFYFRGLPPGLSGPDGNVLATKSPDIGVATPAAKKPPARDSKTGKVVAASDAAAPPAPLPDPHTRPTLGPTAFPVGIKAPALQVLWLMEQRLRGWPGQQPQRNQAGAAVSRAFTRHYRALYCPVRETWGLANSAGLPGWLIRYRKKLKIENIRGRIKCDFQAKKTPDQVIHEARCLLVHQALIDRHGLKFAQDNLGGTNIYLLGKCGGQTYEWVADELVKDEKIGPQSDRGKQRKAELVKQQKTPEGQRGIFIKFTQTHLKLINKKGGQGG